MNAPIVARAYRHSMRILARNTAVWAVLIAVTLMAGTSGYLSAYPTQAERDALARQLGTNPGFQALLGRAYQISTTGGFVAWRFGGIVIVIVAVWALLSASRIMRGEEEDGQTELLLAGSISATQLVVAQFAALATTWASVSVVVFATLVAVGLDVGSSAVLVLGIMTGAMIFGGLGALTSQLVDRRRRASGLAGLALGIAYLVRVVGSGSRGLEWIDWLTPLGWAQRLRPFAGSDLAPTIPIVAATIALVGSTIWARRRRDLGAGLLVGSDSGRSSQLLLHTTTAFAVRLTWATTLVWTAGLAVFAGVYGLLARDMAELAQQSSGFTDYMRRLARGGVDTPAGFIGLAFGILVVVVALFAAFQAVAIRDEEANGHLETLLCLPVSRTRWLVGRIAVSVAGIVLVAVGAGFGAWLGAVAKGADLSLRDTLEAAINTVPVSLFFLGIGTLVAALMPRATSFVAIGAVVTAYLIQVVGSVMRAPGWVLDISPFHHVASVPIQPVDVASALVITGCAALMVAASLVVFRHRDLTGA